MSVACLGLACTRVRAILQRPVVIAYALRVATRQRAPWLRRILWSLVYIPVAAVGVVVVYLLASFADGSLANLSGPVEVAIVGGVLVVLLFCRWLLVRGESASPSSAATDGTATGPGSVRAASWPPGKAAPSAMPIARPTIMPTLPAAPPAWGASAAPTASTAAPSAPTLSTSASTMAPSASTVVRIPTVVGSAPAATAVDREPTRAPRAGETRSTGDTTREAAYAFEGSGATSALAECLDGRSELTNLIASVEARMPSEMPSEMASEPEPDAQPDAQNDAVGGTEADRAEIAVAESTKTLAQAVEQVTRACELIAHACELFAERIESDRQERRTLADAMMLLAQQAMPPAATPRIVDARAARPSLVVENGSPSADRQPTSDELGVTTRTPS